MFCSRCGKELVEGNRFCQACGQEVGAAVPPVTRMPPPPIASSTQISTRLPYAGFWERVAAALIDGLILGIPFWLLVSVMFLTSSFSLVLRPYPPANPREVMALLAPLFGLFFIGMLAFIVVRWLYFAGMESSARQATFGKSLLSLRVTNLEGQRLSFGHATGRFGGKIVSDFIPFLIGYIMAAFTEKKQALHDMIAGTLVLKK
jgi:uncharacterized RDD family membrane protein YckC